MVARLEAHMPTFNREVLIPVETLSQDVIDRYSKVCQTLRVPAKKFIEDTELPGYDTMMAEASFNAPSTPSDDSSKDPSYIP